MTLYRASGLPRLVSLIEGVWAAYPFQPMDIEAVEQGLKDHESLLDELRTRDPEQIAVAIENHLRLSLDRIFQRHAPSRARPQRPGCILHTSSLAWRDGQGVAARVVAGAVIQVRVGDRPAKSGARRLVQNDRGKQRG